MSSQKDIKRRIKSVKNTKQITKAMELVAAVKMKRAQEAGMASRPYEEVASEIARELAKSINPETHKFFKENKAEKNLCLIITTDRGLCGSINAKVIKKALELGVNKTDFIIIGKKGRVSMLSAGANITAYFNNFTKSPDFNEVAPIAKILSEGFLSEKYNKVYIVFTQFITTLSQEPKLEQIMPFTRKDFDGSEQKPQNYEYTFEPSAEEVLESLLHRIVEIKIWQGLLENLASEYSARMVAMKNATDNAGDLIDDLTLDYNQMRQAAITSEISEIASATMTLS